MGEGNKEDTGKSSDSNLRLNFIFPQWPLANLKQGKYNTGLPRRVAENKSNGKSFEHKKNTVSMHMELLSLFAIIIMVAIIHIVNMPFSCRNVCCSFSFAQRKGNVLVIREGESYL